MTNISPPKLARGIERNPLKSSPERGGAPQGRRGRALSTTAKPKRPVPSVGFAATSPFRERI